MWRGGQGAEVWTEAGHEGEVLDGDINFGVGISTQVVLRCK